MIKKFNQLLNKPLYWKHDGAFKCSYTLYEDDAVVAQFRQESGWFKSDASIYVTGEHKPLFVFRPKGVFKSHIETESNHVDFEPAKTLKPRMWGGLSATFADGETYEWKPQGGFRAIWILRSADGIEHARLETTRGWRTQGQLTVLTDHIAPARLNLLLLAGWSQLIFEMQAAAAAG